MAKKAAKSSGEQDVNKSQAIRDYIKANPDEGPTAVAAALNSSQGWDISAAYVSTIKNKMKGPSKSSRSSRSASRSRASSRSAAASGVDAQSLMQAKELAKHAGGINEAKAALDLLAKLTD